MKQPDPTSAHTAFLEAARMLKEESGGGSVLMLEWVVIQKLAQEAAQLFEDLPFTLAPDGARELPRRWWQLQPRFEWVEQMYLIGQVDEDVEESDDEQITFQVKSFLLGRDGVVRVNYDSVWFARRNVPIRAGVLAIDAKAWTHLVGLKVGEGADPAVFEDVTVDEAAQLLSALERLATATRDRIAARLQRLRDGHHV